MSLGQELLKYHSPGNRYAYYPPTSRWNGELHPRNITKVQTKALYLHLPFCNQLCTFCGCNIRINDQKEEHIRYALAIVKEWQLLKENDSFRELCENYEGAPLDQLILGGGTPSVFHPEARQILWNFLRETFPKGIHAGHVEISPRSLTEEFYGECHEIGINSFSFGVQDFDQQILLNVNRKQEFSDITRAFNLLSDDDHRGIDLIWGLPLQKKENISLWKESLEQLELDWISFYPLAKVAWLEPYQNAFGDFTLPQLEEKYLLYEKGVELFTQLGLEHFALGHFIHSKGRLHQSLQNKTLNRSVSGLFLQNFDSSIGLGVGAIGQFNGHYLQNEKIYDRYINIVTKKNQLPHHRGHQLNTQEVSFNSLVKEVITTAKLPQEFLTHFKEDEKLNWFAHEGHITEKGRHFYKNILQRLEIAYFENTIG